TTAKTDTGSGFLANFNSGKVGIDFAGGVVHDVGQKPKFDYGVAPIPGPSDGQWATFSGGDVAAISKSSHHVDEAWDFIKWLTSKATSQSVYLKIPALPPRTDVTAPASLGESFAKTAELVKKGKTYVSTHYNDVIASAQGPWLEMYQSVVFNGADPASATQSA